MDSFLKRKAPQEPDMIDCEMEPQPTTSCEPSSTSSESAPKVAKVDKAKKRTYNENKHYDGKTFLLSLHFI